MDSGRQSVWRRLEAPATDILALLAIIAVVARAVPRVRHFFEHHGIPLDAIWPLALAAFVLLLLAWRNRVDGEVQASAGASLELQRVERELSEAKTELERLAEQEMMRSSQESAVEFARSFETSARELDEAKAREEHGRAIRRALQQVLDEVEHGQAVLDQTKRTQRYWEEEDSPLKREMWEKHRDLLAEERAVVDAYRAAAAAYSGFARVADLASSRWSRAKEPQFVPQGQSAYFTFPEDLEVIQGVLGNCALATFELQAAIREST
jgi:hypothetical protein